MAKPEGYRKAQRLFNIASKFNLPIVTFIDTPGAFPGVEAEDRGTIRSYCNINKKIFVLDLQFFHLLLGKVVQVVQLQWVWVIR